MKNEALMLETIRELRSDVKALMRGFSDLRLETHNAISTIKTDIAVNKVKSSFFGSIGGAFAFLAAVGLQWANKKLHF